MRVGDVVLLTRTMLGNPIHTVGVCYENYVSGGASFIFENGDYDGFSKEEQKMFLHLVAHDTNLQDYHFINVMSLVEDYRCDIFTNVLEPSDNAGLPTLSGVGPAIDCFKRIKLYLQSHPDAAWKEIYKNVANHYHTLNTMRSAMKNRFGFSINTYRQRSE